MGRYGGNDLTKLSRDVKDSGANMEGGNSATEEIAQDVAKDEP